MPAANKPSDDGKKFFDIAKPGATPPSASSRPLIVGHKIMQDPMVNASSPADATVPTPAEPKVPEAAVTVPDQPTAPALPGTEPEKEIIMPELIPDKPAQPTAPKAAKGKAAAKADEDEGKAKDADEMPEPKSDAPALPATDEEAAVPAENAASASAEPAQSPEADAGAKPSGSTRVVMPISDISAGGDKDKPAETDKDGKYGKDSGGDGSLEFSDKTDTEKTDEAEDTGPKTDVTPDTENLHIEELIANKTYFVPIGQHHHGKGGSTATAILLGLILGLLILAGIIYVIDAEILDIGIELPFDLIKV